MIERAQVIGAGRAGSAIAARLRERGLDLDGHEPELVLLCVPDRAIADVARTVGPDHGSRTSAARRRSPRSTPTHGGSGFTRCRRSRASAAPSSSTGPSRRSAARRTRRARSGTGSPARSGCEPFTLADGKRAAYHAGAAIASNYLVTLRRAAGSLLTAAGAPPEALDPLMRRTIENGFELTGPIARGDWETVDAHVEAIRAERPELEPLYVTLAETTKALL